MIPRKIVTLLLCYYCPRPEERQDCSIDDLRDLIDEGFGNEGTDFYLTEKGRAMVDLITEASSTPLEMMWQPIKEN